jgi:hypothetical protein
MSAFWWIVIRNWTLEERAQLRAYVEAWMAADHTVSR